MTLLYVGHLTLDLTPAGHTPGGSVLYGSTVFKALGGDVAVHTTSQEVPAEIQKFDLRWTPSAHTTTFENRYVGGQRQQWVHAIADPLPAPPRLDVPFVHLAPVLHEIDLPSWLSAAQTSQSKVALSLQGLLREVTPDGRVLRQAFDPQNCRGAQFLFLSDEDLGPNLDLLNALRKIVPVVVLTRGELGSTLFEGPNTTQIGIRKTNVVDPTGAGDAFAAAFLFAVIHQATNKNAARLGAAAASHIIEHQGLGGLSALPSLAEIPGQ